MKRAWLALFSLTALLLPAGGCKRGDATTTAAPNKPATTATVNASTDPITAVPDKDRYKVTADTTGFFRYSPLQAAGSDFDLKKNARLTMLKRGRGFSQVKTANNETGYVGTEDIAQLPPNEIAQEDAATLQAAEAAAGAQSTSLPLAAAGTTLATTRNVKKTGAPMSSYHIPSDADANVRLPEPDVKPKGTPTPSPSPSSR